MRTTRTVTIAVAAAVLVVLPGVAQAKTTPQPAPNFLLTQRDGSPVRWYPCQAITYKVNLNGAPAKELTRVRQAMRKVAAQTGIGFTDQGPSDVVATTDLQEATRQAGTDLLISFAHTGSGPGQTTLVEPLTGGIGGLASGRGGTYPGWGHTGGVVISLDGLGKLSGSRRLELYMHELGHAMGLAHVGAGNIMAPSGRRGIASWGPVDVAGLRAVGRGLTDCVNANDQRPATEAPQSVVGLTSTANPDGTFTITWERSPNGSRATAFVVTLTYVTGGSYFSGGRTVIANDYTVTQGDLVNVHQGTTLTALVAAVNEFGQSDEAAVHVTG